MEFIKGDVRKITPKLNQKFDRIIMPLPKKAHTFLDCTLSVIKKGTIIHLYTFGDETETKEIVKEAKEFYKISKKKIKILDIVRCGQYSPNVFRHSIDFKIL